MMNLPSCLPVDVANAILGALPDSQRDLARRRLEWAAARGWKQVSLFSRRERPPGVDDLFGIAPDDGLAWFMDRWAGAPAE